MTVIETLKKLRSRAVQKSILDIDGYDRWSANAQIPKDMVISFDAYNKYSIPKLCAKQEDAISVELIVINNVSKVLYYDKYVIHSNQSFLIDDRVEELQKLSMELYGYNVMLVYMDCTVIQNQGMVEHYRQFVMSTVDRLDLDIDVPKYLTKKEMVLYLKETLKKTLMAKSASAISLKDYIETSKYEDCESHIKLVDLEKRKYIEHFLQPIEVHYGRKSFNIYQLGPSISDDKIYFKEDEDSPIIYITKEEYLKLGKIRI